MALINKISRYFPIFFQLTRYGIVGVVAASVHFAVVVLLVEFAKMQPLVANLFAFLVSFQVSYWGHRSWTFKGTEKSHREAFSKLLFINVINMMANEGLFYTFLTFGLPYKFALLLVLTILPPITFVLGKFWVFQV